MTYSRLHIIPVNRFERVWLWEDRKGSPYFMVNHEGSSMLEGLINDRLNPWPMSQSGVQNVEGYVIWYRTDIVEQRLNLRDEADECGLT